MQTKKTLIMVVDDEPQIRKLLRISLESEGYKIEEAKDAKEAMKLSAIVKPDFLIIDLGLPDEDGKEVIKNIRQWSEAPIMVCSVRNNDEEVVECLNIGADDYIFKPFNPDVLLARIQANLRKSIKNKSGEPNIKNGDIEMDLVRHEILINKKPVSLTPKEYDLLRYFLINRGKMITHNQLLKDVWGNAHEDYVQYLRVYIKQLRQKIEKNPKDPKFIITEPGIGYRMEQF
jgi:two-component system KDP operon response regulator KdpE